jgi:hypothetical protein
VPAESLTPTPWHDLPRRDQERVPLLVSTLSEFAAGFSLMHDNSSRVSSRVHPSHRFIVNGLDSYLHALYMAGDQGAQSILRSIGLTEQAIVIDVILEMSVGTTTLRGFLQEHRNTILAHPSFTTGPAMKRVFEKADLHDPKTAAEYNRAKEALVQATRALHVLLRRLYPEAARSEDDWVDRY